MLADVLAVVIDEQEILLRGRTTVMAALAEHSSISRLCAARSHLDWRISCYDGSADEHHAELRFVESSLVAVTVPIGPEHIECWSAPHESRNEDLADLLWLEIKNQRARIESQTIGSYLPQCLDYDCNAT